MTRFTSILLLGLCGFDDVRRSRVCSLKLLLVLARAFSGRSPAGLVIILCCLKFETLHLERERERRESGVKRAVRDTTVLEGGDRNKIGGSIDMQHLYFLLFFHYMFRLHAAIFRWVFFFLPLYRWTHLILINVNLVQQDATIQENWRV
jgi:hypothetical protein